LRETFRDNVAASTGENWIADKPQIHLPTRISVRKVESCPGVSSTKLHAAADRPTPPNCS
jgi:hypothetical protein